MSTTMFSAPNNERSSPPDKPLNPSPDGFRIPSRNANKTSRKPAGDCYEGARPTSILMGPVATIRETIDVNVVNVGALARNTLSFIRGGLGGRNELINGTNVRKLELHDAGRRETYSSSNVRTCSVRNVRQFPYLSARRVQYLIGRSIT